jgi:hypothetical protein
VPDKAATSFKLDCFFEMLLLLLCGLPHGTRACGLIGWPSLSEFVDLHCARFLKGRERRDERYKARLRADLQTFARICFDDPDIPVSVPGVLVVGCRNETICLLLGARSYTKSQSIPWWQRIDIRALFS